NVHLDAKGGNGEIVNKVFAGEEQLDVAPCGDVQLIAFSQASGLLAFPHSLLSDDVDVEGVHGHAAIIHVDHRAPAEHGHSQKQGNGDPGGFQSHVAVNRNSDIAGILAAVLKKEIDNGRGDSHGEKRADGGDVDHQRIDARGEVRGLV